MIEIDNARELVTNAGGGMLPEDFDDAFIGVVACPETESIRAVYCADMLEAAASDYLGCGSADASALVELVVSQYAEGFARPLLMRGLG